MGKSARNRFAVSSTFSFSALVVLRRLWHFIVLIIIDSW